MRSGRSVRQGEGERLEIRKSESDQSEVRVTISEYLDTTMTLIIHDINTDWSG